MSSLQPCRMCENELSPQASFCPQCGHPRIEPESRQQRPQPGGVADMSGANMRQIVAVIEQNMEMLRETAIHGSGDMKALAIALLKAREEAPPKRGEFLSDFSTPLPPEDASPEEAD